MTVSVSDIVTAIMAICAAIATFVNLRLKADVQKLQSDAMQANTDLERKITAKLDDFQREFRRSFVATDVDVLQRQGITERVAHLQKEVDLNRTRLHDVSGEIMKNLTGEIFRLNALITEKAQVIAETKSAVQSMDRRIDTLNDAVDEIASGRK